jgi:predicted nucleic acid-binding protein
LPTSPDLLLLDTSAAIALVSPGHSHHDRVRERARGHALGLGGHAEWETYSVLTRLPPPRRLSPASALRLIRTNFPESRRLPQSAAETFLEELSDHGIAGGSVYDALVGAAARHHDLPLVSCDSRALPVYRALRVDVVPL